MPSSRYTVTLLSGNRLERYGNAVLDDLDRVIFEGDPRRSREGWWWVVHHKGTPVGFAGLRRSVSWSNVLYLCRAGVLPEHRGHGLQQRLIHRREEFARNGWAGVVIDFLVTDTTDNAPSANNLITCGFRLYEPAEPWAFKRSLYWIKDIRRR